LLNGKDQKHSRYASNVSIVEQELSALEQTKNLLDKVRASAANSQVA